MMGVPVIKTGGKAQHQQRRKIVPKKEATKPLFLIITVNC